GLEQAGLGLPGARERAALPAEQLGLEQGLGDGRAIHGDERRAGADAGTVDRLGDQTLAGSRLAEEEDGRRAPGGLGLASEHAGELLAQGDGSWAPAEKLGEGR